MFWLSSFVCFDSLTAGVVFSFVFVLSSVCNVFSMPPVVSSLGWVVMMLLIVCFYVC